MARTPEPSRRSSGRRPSGIRLAAAFAVTAALGAVVFTGVGRATPAPQAKPDTIIIGGVTPRFALPDCVPKRADDASRAACKTISEVLRRDLAFEGLFQFVPESLLTAIPPQNPEAPNFEDWKGIGASHVIVTRAEVANGELALDLFVYFVNSGTRMVARHYTGKDLDNPRLFAHQASDDVMGLTQYRGVARTRIAFASDRDSTKERRTKEIYIVDYDGANPRRVTVNGSLNITPTWTPDGKGIAYVSYRQGSPLIFLARIFEGRSLANLSGEHGDSQAFAPSFSPDGRSLAFASNRSGNMDVWVASADGSGARRLTTTRASDTAPCWSPTGQEIAFTSDRAGTPQLWIMDADGLNVRRLTTVGNWNDGCAWNPSKQFSEVAYTARLEAGGFDIAIMDLASRQVRQITQGRGSCEYPSWAPNGRHLVFSCNRGSRWAITVSDRDGRSLETLSTGPGNNVQPEWGP